MAAELKGQSGRRHLFDTFSFVTLTCVGDTKVVPIGQTASTLTWLEAVIGQFYMAIVVAQLVGLKLTQVRQRRRLNCANAYCKLLPSYAKESGENERGIFSSISLGQRPDIRESGRDFC